MSVEHEVRSDLVALNSNKSKLMQRYSDRQKEILNDYGGSIGDIPMNSEHEYHQIQRKIVYLGSIS